MRVVYLIDDVAYEVWADYAMGWMPPKNLDIMYIFIEECDQSCRLN